MSNFIINFSMRNLELSKVYRIIKFNPDTCDTERSFFVFIKDCAMQGVKMLSNFTLAQIMQNIARLSNLTMAWAMQDVEYESLR